MTSCERWQEALSARLDGEDPGTPIAALDTHLRGCARCRRYAAGLDVLDGVVLGAPAPDRSAAVLAAVRADRDALRRRQSGGRTPRAALVVVAVAQLLTALPYLLPVAEGHSARDLGAFELALAVGFLVAAVRPATAVGLLPTAGVLALVLAVVVGVDIAAGRAAAGAESVHVTEWVGVMLVWLIAQQQPPPVRLRPA